MMVQLQNEVAMDLECGDESDSTLNLEDTFILLEGNLEGGIGDDYLYIPDSQEAESGSDVFPADVFEGIRHYDKEDDGPTGFFLSFSFLIFFFFFNITFHRQ